MRVGCVVHPGGGGGDCKGFWRGVTHGAGSGG
jgi:hypothetical protein